MENTDEFDILMNDLKCLESEDKKTIKAEIQECIELLSISGNNTKYIVSNKLKNIIKRL